MPIYEYQCQKCGTHIEKRQSISELPLTECEKCGGRLEKQVSLSGFQFKGSGWYVTDYAAKKESKTEKSDGSAKSEKSSEGASAEKSEKSSSGESTAKADAASNTKSDTSSAAKKEIVSKKE